MLDFIDLQVIRIEGIEYDPADLSVSLVTDSKCIGKVYPLSQANEMNPIRIPSICYLQFVIKIVSHQEQIISSVTLQTQILPKEGYQWVPLFQCSNDLIYSFPKEIGPIKLLIYIKSKRPLSPVQEITENSEQGSEINSSMTFREETMPELKFSNESIDEKEREEKQAYYSLRIIELEQIIQRDRFNFNEELIRSGQEYKKAIDQISIELEIYKAKSKNFQKLIDEFKEENEGLRVKLEEEKEKSQVAEENLQKNILQSKMCENSLMKILEKKDSDLFDLQNQIKVLKNENQELQDLNKAIQQEKDSLQSKFSISLENSCSKNNQENISKIDSLSEPKKIIQAEDDVDRALKENLKHFNLKNIFKKQQSNIYCYAGKKIYMIVKSGVLLCRAGGGLQSFEEYVKGIGLYRPKSNPRGQSPIKIEHRRTKTALGELKNIDDRIETDSSSMNSYDVSPSKPFRAPSYFSKSKSLKKNKEV